MIRGWLSAVDPKLTKLTILTNNSRFQLSTARTWSSPEFRSTTEMILDKWKETLSTKWSQIVLEIKRATLGITALPWCAYWLSVMWLRQGTIIKMLIFICWVILTLYQICTIIEIIPFRKNFCIVCWMKKTNTNWKLRPNNRSRAKIYFISWSNQLFWSESESSGQIWFQLLKN